MAPRLTTAALALIGAAAFGAVATAASTGPGSPMAVAGRAGPMIPGFLSVAALACLVLALPLSEAGPIGLALALLGAAWLVGTPASGAWPTLAAVAAGALLAVAELAYWSLDFKVAGKDPPSIHVRRGAAIAALAGASIALALVPELNLSLTPLSGLELTAIGLLGAAALIAVAASLARRLRLSLEPPELHGPAAPD